jgi:hypothetical protein
MKTSGARPTGAAGSADTANEGMGDVYISAVSARQGLLGTTSSNKDTTGNNKRGKVTSKVDGCPILGPDGSAFVQSINGMGLSWYKLPKLDYLLLDVISENAFSASLARTVSPSRLHDLLTGHIITFEPLSAIRFQLSPDHVLTYRVLDWRVDGCQLNKSIALISISTQIIVKSDPQIGHKIFERGIVEAFCSDRGISDMWETQDPYILSCCCNTVSKLSGDTNSSGRSILLVGESGTGMTTIVRGISHKFSIPLVLLNVETLFCVKGVSPDVLVSRAFNCAALLQPCIMLIDDLECLCPPSARISGEIPDVSLLVKQVRVSLW